ncbi:toprim domain-containing protein, partial [Parafilimonas sp.]|uniref:toprim domain-containing protein n=1 Tax=Parafilimonas sp. TaxID=1969739 RepID=UPI003F80DCDC
VADNKLRLLTNNVKESEKPLSFQQQKKHPTEVVKRKTDTLFHLHENSMINEGHAAERAIKIIAAKQPITHPLLCRYLKERGINKNVADRYCHEVSFKLNNKEREHISIGFKNNAGGYELRNGFFKLSSAPKYVTYISNSDAENEHNDKEQRAEILSIDSGIIPLKINDQNLASNAKNPEPIFEQNQTAKHTKSIAVFEGFFDFLSWQTIHQNQDHKLTDFLILNSLSFFERSLLLMEKHEHIKLYLDHDAAGRKCTEQALKRSARYEDKSRLYKNYKDLNDWLKHFGKLEKKQTLRQSKGLGLE